MHMSGTTSRNQGEFTGLATGRAPGKPEVPTVAGLIDESSVLEDGSLLEDG